MNVFKKLIIFVFVLFLAFAVSAQEDRKEKLADQIAEFNASIKSSPDDAELYIKRAEVGYDLNAVFYSQKVSSYKLMDVMTDVNKAIELKPDKASYYNIRANYKKLIFKDLEGAAKDMGKAIELEPTNPQWYLNRTNYVNILAACKDWETCSELGDSRCTAMYQQICEQRFVK